MGPVFASSVAAAERPQEVSIYVSLSSCLLDGLFLISS